MPFSTTGSVISTDLDNMVRGLYRDNSDTALTGTLTETTMKSVAIGANIIGATGAIHVIIGGTITGNAGSKTLRVKFGGVLVDNILGNAGTTQDWQFDIWIFNNNNTTQRIMGKRRDDTTPNLIASGAGTINVDTTQTQTLALTGQLGNVGDTITVRIFDVFVVQIN
jgi:hypothetical protein